MRRGFFKVKYKLHKVFKLQLRKLFTSFRKKMDVNEHRRTLTILFTLNLVNVFVRSHRRLTPVGGRLEELLQKQCTALSPRGDTAHIVWDSSENNQGGRRQCSGLHAIGLHTVAMCIGFYGLLIYAPLYFYAAPKRFKSGTSVQHSLICY